MKYFSALSRIPAILHFANAPFYIFLHILCTCLNHFRSAVLLVIFLNLFLQMVNMQNSLVSVFTLLGIYILLLSGIGTFSVWFENYYKPTIWPQVQEKFRNVLFQRSIASDLENFDQPDFYNEYIWAITQSDTVISGTITALSELMDNLITTICIVCIFFRVDFRIAIPVFLCVAVTAILFSRIINENYCRETEMAPLSRKTEYFKRVFYLKEYAKELRLTGIGKLLTQQFDEHEENVCRMNRIWGRRLCFWNTANGLAISTFLDIGLRILLTYQLMVSHTISIGEYTASTFAIWSLFSGLNGLSSSLHSLSEYSMKADKIFRFLKERPQVYVNGRKEPPLRNQNRILCQNLSFRYHGNQDFTIENLSFELHQGETLAIVGENGSGKSTLIKLLLGLYMPQSGEILINDNSLINYNITAYRKLFSVIFQDFSFFSASVAQNIMLDLQWDKTELYDALEQSLYRKDPYLKRIPLDTCMTKEFNDDGIILSGGQAQKLVITRAFLKPPFVLMDEPSSELDVSSERELNELILQNSGRKGILIIAHRLTTTRRADRILVLSHGKKVEEGNHEELMRQKGHYHRMFMAQAKQYQEN